MDKGEPEDGESPDYHGFFIDKERVCCFKDSLEIEHNEDGTVDLLKHTLDNGKVEEFINKEN